MAIRWFDVDRAEVWCSFSQRALWTSGWLGQCFLRPFPPDPPIGTQISNVPGWDGSAIGTFASAIDYLVSSSQSASQLVCSGRRVQHQQPRLILSSLSISLAADQLGAACAASAAAPYHLISINRPHSSSARGGVCISKHRLIISSSHLNHSASQRICSGRRVQQQQPRLFLSSLSISLAAHLLGAACAASAVSPLSLSHLITCMCLSAQGALRMSGRHQPAVTLSIQVGTT